MRAERLLGGNRLVVLALLLGVVAVGLQAPQPARAGHSPFTDIDGSNFKGDIEWLYAEGVSGGCTPTKYCPDDRVTRQQMASFLARWFALPATTSDFFTDDEASIHEGDINRLAAAGVTGGCTPTTFCPTAYVTRDQMASFIARAAGLTEGAGRNYFYDDNGNLHEPNIDRAAATGIASGWCGRKALTPPV